MKRKEKLGISLSELFDGRLETFKNNSIEYMEFRAIKGNDRDYIKSLVDEALSEKQKSGIKTPTVHLPHCEGFDLSATDEAQRLAAIENHKAILGILLPLEPEIAVVHPSCGVVDEADYEPRVESLIMSLKEFAPWCKSHGVKIAVENLTQVSMVQTSDVLLKILDEVGDNIGVCFDVNHLFKEKHSDFIKRLGDKIITMHISDNDGKVEKHYYPGDGVIDFSEILKALDFIGYDSTMIFECTVHNTFPDSVTELYTKWKSVHPNN